MDYIVKKVGDAEFTFYVNSRGNRSGFVHECELDMNGEHISAAKRQYYNRTWEKYRFQSVMLDAVENAVEQVKARIAEAVKAENGWANLTQARREIVAAAVEENSAYIALRALHDDVYASEYGTEDEHERLKSLNVLNALLEILFSDRDARKASPVV